MHWLVKLEAAGRNTIDDGMPMFAQALAFSAFLAIPSILLLAVGLFTLLSGPQTITNVIDRLHGVMPAQVTTLISDTLHRLDQRHGTSLVMVVVGAALALWSTTGAMTTFMTAVNLAHGHKDERHFVTRRLLAVAMVAVIGFAFLLVAVLLIFGPTAEKYVGNATHLRRPLNWIWWTAQWPILVVGLFAAFATLLYLGPDHSGRRWRIPTAGTSIAVAIWLVLSGAFAFYTSHFSSYNKAWGSFAAVIVMLTWLWLSSLALLFGAEVDAVPERTRSSAE
jgi:membrane protein